MKITFDNLSSLPISLRELELLKALLNDLNEINSKLDKEIYIDWNNEHTEYSPERVDPCPDYYGMYRLWQGNNTLGIEMDLETLDYVMCVLSDIFVNEKNF